MKIVMKRKFAWKFRVVRKERRPRYEQWVRRPQGEWRGCHKLELARGPWNEAQSGGRELWELRCLKCGSAAKQLSSWWSLAMSTFADGQGDRIIWKSHVAGSGNVCLGCGNRLKMKNAQGKCASPALMEGGLL